MEVVHRSCAGIDIGKRSLTVCVIRTDADGVPVKETRTFRTITRDLLALADWFDEPGVVAVPMEATGSLHRHGRAASCLTRVIFEAGSQSGRSRSAWPV